MEFHNLRTTTSLKDGTSVAKWLSPKYLYPHSYFYFTSHAQFLSLFSFHIYRETFT